MYTLQFFSILKKILANMLQKPHSHKETTKKYNP
jgi:hypothetical protein